MGMWLGRAVSSGGSGSVIAWSRTRAAWSSQGVGVIEAVQVLWSPAGVTLSSVGAHALVDVTDGDTPNIRMPVRMLSVDTPEVTAHTEARAREVDEEFTRL